MSESERVQRWRQRQREAGKKPRTIWLTDAENLRLEDRALSRNCSVSELVQRMLAQGQGESQVVTATVTDTEQLRAVADTVTDTIRQELPLLVRLVVEELRLRSALSVADTVTDTILHGVTATITDTNSTDVAVTVADTASPFDTTRYRLGKLCPHGHDYEGTGKSLRVNNKAGYCLACNAATNQRKRARKRQEVSA